MADDAVFGMRVDLVDYRAALDQSVALAGSAATRIVNSVATAGRGAGAAFASLVDQFGRPLQNAKDAGAALEEAGEKATAAGGKAREAGHGFELSGQQLARFAAIGVQEVIPALDGSRV